MTVASSVNRTVVTGNGSATTFAYTFKITTSSHLVVIRSTSAGVDTTLTLGTHYSVTGVGSESGGSITYPLSGTALPAGDRLIMLRSVPLTQLTDLTNQGAFYAETHETTFDNLCMADQQLSERLDRAVTVPPSDSGSLVLPNAVTRAGKYLTFDGSGNATTSATAEITGSLMAMESTGNGSSTVWTLPAVVAGGSRSLVVSVDGVVQPVSSYTVASDQLTFGQAPPLNSAIDVRIIGAPVVVSLADSTQVTATGTVTARTLAARFADTINVLDYGAVGDGTTDNTTAIQAAITAAGPTKRRVFFPVGNYLTGPLTIGTEGQRYTAELVGESWNGDIGQSNTGGVTITLKSAANASLFTVASTAAPARFENLNLQGQRTLQTGIVQGGSDRSYGVWFVDYTTNSTKQRSGHFYNCRIENFASGGVRVGTLRNAGTMDRVTILNAGRTETGTAQAGGAATITLASAATAVDATYAAMNIVITGGTGVGQKRTISTYVGATRVATVSVAWEVVPDATSTYRITLVLGDCLLIGSCNDWRVYRCDFGGATRNCLYLTGGGSIVFNASNCFTADENGVQVDSTAIDAWFYGCSIDTNYGNGVWLRGQSSSPDQTFPRNFIGCRFNQNSRGADNTYSDIRLTNEHTGAVVGCMFVRGSSAGTNDRYPKYLIQTDGTTESVRWTANTYSTQGSDSFTTGTAQAGSATTITLASGSSSTTDFYKAAQVVTTGGTGSGQTKTITAYNGTTKVATVSAWSVNPDATTTYKIVPQVPWVTDLTNDRTKLVYVGPEFDGLLDVRPDTGRVGIVSTTPRLVIEETDAGADAKKSYVDSAAGLMRFALLNDAENASTQWLNVGRSGTSVSYITLGGALASETFRVTPVASQVNRVEVTGAVTTAAPAISAGGSDTNINLKLTPKGTGSVQFGTHTASADAAVSGYVTIVDAGGTTRKLAVIT